MARQLHLPMKIETHLYMRIFHPSDQLKNPFSFCLYLLIMLFLVVGCQRTPASTALPRSDPSTTKQSSPSGIQEKPATASVVNEIQAKTTITPIPPTITPEAQPPTIAPPAEPVTTTLLFTGVIVPARCVQATIDELGDPDYPYHKVRDMLTNADLSIGVLNATMSDRIEHTGCNWSYQMVGGASNADAAARTGFDVMSVATNHIKDCGTMKSWCNFALIDTLENLNRVGIRTVGAGKNLEAALQPVIITMHGVRFGFVALGDSKMSMDVFATDTNPGIALLNKENMQAAISLARQNADIVIALPHWGPEASAKPTAIQLRQAQHLVEAGADLVVGNHTHVVQAIEEIDGVPVFYGLGNLIFDQWYPEYRQGVILLVKFQGTKYLGYELIPTHTDQDGQARLAEPDEAAEIIQRIKDNSKSLR